LKLGKWFGIEVNLHVTFLLLIGFLAFTGFVATRTQGGGGRHRISAGVVPVRAAARVWSRAGGAALRHPTKDITLWPIGGVARLERMPTDPKQELVVALAGPAVNVVIAIALLPILIISAAAFFERLFMTNLFLVAFNMIPAFPMDGGVCCVQG